MSTFYLDYNVTGNERKRLVKAIAAYTKAGAKYLGAPTFAYEVDYFHIDRKGCVSFDDRADSEEIEGLIDVLVGQGFVAQVSDLGIPTAEAEEPEQATEEPTSPTTEPASKAPVEAEGNADATGLTISLPLDGFNPDSLDRLQKLVASKATLMKKALGATRLTIQASDGTVRFPWWDALPEAEEVGAYTAFIAALCRMAKQSKRVTGTERDVESEKYAFRGFLLRLGFIGVERKEHRKLLLMNLSGTSAFPNKAAADAFAATQKEKRIAAKTSDAIG